MYRFTRFITIVLMLTFVLAGCQVPTNPADENLRAPGQNQDLNKPGKWRADLIVPDDYPTIQEAVDAAQPGDVVLVKAAGGPYLEQVVISKDLTLRGMHNPVIQAPDHPEYFTVQESGSTWEPVVFAYGGTESGGAISGSETADISISGFIIDGNGRQPASPANRTAGILLRNVSGRDGISHNTVRNLGVGGRETIGIMVYGDSRLTIAGNTVSDYERGGIGANGDGGAHPAPNVIIRGNHVTGTTGIGEAWAPNGIQIGFGATGSIIGNTVEDNRWAASPGSGDFASGIIVFEADHVQVRENRVTNSDTGIDVGAWSWLLPSADHVLIAGNQVKNAFSGILLESDALDPYSHSDPSVSHNLVINNVLTSGLPGGVGIKIDTVDTSTEYDPVALHNRIMNNVIHGFDTDVVDEGAGTIIHNRFKPFSGWQAHRIPSSRTGRLRHHMR